MNHPYSINQINYIKPFSIRSKTRILYNIKNETFHLHNVHNWNYDGGSCGQSNLYNSDFFISPKALFNDPLRKNSYIELHPKPLISNNKINSSGAHTNYSTNSLRNPDIEPLNGNIIINTYIEKLAKKHIYHMEKYGEFNDLRLIGSCNTSSLEKFTYGISDCSASIRIPKEVAQNGYG